MPIHFHVNFQRRVHTLEQLLLAGQLPLTRQLPHMGHVLLMQCFGDYDPDNPAQECTERRAKATDEDGSRRLIERAGALQN
jgi:hypothetical protein